MVVVRLAAIDVAGRASRGVASGSIDLDFERGSLKRRPVSGRRSPQSPEVSSPDGAKSAKHGMCSIGKNVMLFSRLCGPVQSGVKP